MNIHVGNDCNHPKLGSCRYLGYSASGFVWYVYSTDGGGFHYTPNLPEGWVDPDF